MQKEDRTRFAFVALVSMALGCAITYGVERLNVEKPVIISDAVYVAPQPTVIQPAAVADSKVAAPKHHRSGTKSARQSYKKITSGVIDINTADLDQLEELPGVGPSTAQAIIDFRTQSGGFRSPDELGDIPRMGKKKLAKLMPFVAL